MFYIQAMNIHQGGGKTLLLGILQCLDARNDEAMLLVDERFEHGGDWPSGITVRCVSPTLRARLGAEYWLSRQMRASDTLLCLGNLPPLFHVAGKVMVYFHNRHIVEWPVVAGFPRKARLRLWIERQWVRRLSRHVHHWLVQTPSMKTLVHEIIDVPLDAVDLLNFAPDVAGMIERDRERKLQDPVQFVYPASGDPHKNHRKLVGAWALLKLDGLKPILHLTVDASCHAPLARWIEAKCEMDGLSIINHGLLPPNELAVLCGDVDALIYPSLGESLGLPLLEARRHGLPVLAGELDYVRDAVAPVETFDPDSARSIARAVRRFIGRPEQPLAIGSPADLLDYIGFNGSSA